MRLIAKHGHSRPTSQFVTLERPARNGSGTPNGWRTAPLRSLCLATELTDPTKSPDTSFQYVDVSAVSNQLWKIIGSMEHLGTTAPSRARKLVRANDAIFATVRPMLRRIAMVPEYLDGQIVSTAFCVLRANPRQADSQFIYYSLLTDKFIERIGNLQRGASYPAVTDGDVLGQEMLVPPLAEQCAIAAVLSNIQAAVEVQDKIVAALKELKIATMAKLFREGLRGESLKQTEIGEIPESWEVMLLGNCATIRYGLGQPPERAVDGVPMIRATDIKRGRIVGSGILRVRRNAIPLSRNPFLNTGDIIVVRSGAHTGDAAVITSEWQDAVAGYDLIITPSDALDSAFLGNFVLGEFAQRFFLAQRDRSAQPHINSQQPSALLIPVPSLEEQRGIARISSGLDDKTTIASGRLQALRVLFSSMLHLLMTGQVGVKDLQVQQTVGSLSTRT